MRRSLLVSIFVLLLSPLVLEPTPLHAQAVGEAGNAPAPVEHDRIISINPLLLVFLGYVSIDYEHRVADATTLGASASSFSFSDASYLTVDAKARYYVQDRALEGLSVGTLVGYTRLEDDETGDRSNALAVGFNVENQWLLGVDERLALTAGIGGSRLFGADDRDSFRTILPIIRLSLGWGF